MVVSESSVCLSKGKDEAIDRVELSGSIQTFNGKASGAKANRVGLAHALSRGLPWLSRK